LAILATAWLLVLNCPRNGAMNYFDTATENGILSIHYQIRGGFCRKLGGGIRYFILQIEHLYIGTGQYKDVLFAEEINANLISPKFGNCLKKPFPILLPWCICSIVYMVIDAPDCI